MGLKEYKAKRDFRQTREPAGSDVRVSQGNGAARFVIQKHAATRLHYDFRLEMEGVLKSWAVPKGLPLQRNDRRLAIQVEDHPIDYGDFEGTIPPGNYGAGTVMLWDTGTFEVLGADPLQALKAGRIHLTLKGEKLKGDWALVRMRPRDGEDKPQWLILKSGSDQKPLSKRAENQSAISQRTMEQIAAHNERQWQSDRPARRATSAPALRARPIQTVTPRLKLPQLDRQRLAQGKPRFVEPMKALLVKELPRGDSWLYEIKFDGVRALAIKDGRAVSLISRAEKVLTDKYALVTSELERLPARQVVLDGEVVAVDERGRPSFQLLQSYHMAGAKKPPLVYYVFDLLHLDGKDLLRLPLLQRKAMAEALLADFSSIVRFSAGIQTDSERVRRELQARGLEGLIAKKKDSSYEPGRRSGAWVKFKWTNEQEFVIGGYTPPQGARSYFGALLVGYYENGRLLYAGKVGTGFSEKVLRSLHQQFQKLTRKDCPFGNLPKKRAAARGGLTASQMKSCTWLEPRLVCQVRFAEWTRDHQLRQPSFLGLREDKKPQDVVREKPAARHPHRAAPDG